MFRTVAFLRYFCREILLYDMLHILQIGDVLVSPDLLTECFCCDLAACKGACCVEGESGAPLAPGEDDELRRILPEVLPSLSHAARRVLKAQGVAYCDADGDRVTSLVGGRDCVFTCYEGDICLCAAEKAEREGRTAWPKPVSCALYPVRELKLSNGLTGLNYHRWSVCEAAVRKGRKLRLPLYKFLREPLIRRFGAEWYAELTAAADELLPEADESAD